MRREDRIQAVGEQRSRTRRRRRKRAIESAVGNFGGYLRASSRSIGKDPSAEEDR